MGVYMCIDLKTFYASVECVERKLDPFNTNLVVADESRGKGSICLAVSPKMKMLGVKNRCRLFEIPKNIKYIIAKPRMNKYIEYSANIYSIYLKYVDKQDIHVYSIDEAFLDVTSYLKLYNMSCLELAKKILNDIYDKYKLTATCGIGTNLYLAKIALDILSKHSVTNIDWLDEKKYIKKLWHHKPLSDFWQIGNGIEKRLNKLNIYDMCDIANSDHKKLYKEFGINAELLIDHSYGKESCTMKDIKNYKSKSKSISSSQILFEDYNFSDARLILKEMVEQKSLELVEKDLETYSIKLYIGYSKDIIKSTGGSRKLSNPTNVYSKLIKEFLELYDKTTNRIYPIRRIGIAFCKLYEKEYEQIDLFVDLNSIKKEKNLEKTIYKLKQDMGKNVILKGMNLQEKSTAKLRNTLVGGHNG